MSSNKSQYTLADSGEFSITDYNSTKPFSSFFPGVAGQNGIPMWTFYVNRGQCVCSMGIMDKEHAIMEFLPANRAYQLASTQGFRTFIKPKSSELDFYEPFQSHFADRKINRTQRMTITPAMLALEEINHSLGLTFTVEYSNVVQDDYAGLIRTLRITNNGGKPFALQGLDGLPLVVPYGVDNGSLKFTRRLVEAFVEVANHDQHTPLFRGKVEPVDRPEVVPIKQGNFYLGFEINGQSSQRVAPIVDPEKIFGSQRDYSYPEKFLSDNEEELMQGQILENRFPCAMGLFNANIAPGESYVYASIVGHADSVEKLNSMTERISDSAYIARQRAQNQELIEQLTQGNLVCSQEPAFDQYVRQNYLDNGLRGGFPVTLEGKDNRSTLYMYARKHGDLERDYNHFSLSPTNYSQGNANYRDVNQNRRSDLFFNPEVRDDNVRQFYNLIQLDGFNPLVIKEVTFLPNDIEQLERLLIKHLGADYNREISTVLSEPFTPGSLMAWLHAQNISLLGKPEAFIAELLGICDRASGTEHGEGFWTDHWSYNLDLLENYLALYPEDAKKLLFVEQVFSFYDNAHRVKPRHEKYVLWDGNAMQLNAVVLDEEKDSTINARNQNKHLVHTDLGQGEVYYTNLFNKIFCLLVNKLASLDPEGVGVEMESDKPNWYDALNGLPGVLGSSLCETLEVKRNLLFLQQQVEKFGTEQTQWLLFEELYLFFDTLCTLLEADLPCFAFWDRASAVKEAYRERTKFGISGQETNVPLRKIQQFLDLALQKLDAGITKAFDNDTGIPSTYFINEVTHYEIITNDDGSQKTDANGRACFKALGFKQSHLPLFLEGPVHYLRTTPERSHAREFVRRIKKSGLYDQKLRMYKVNASLNEQPMEIGRARVFSPGWFENESIWLHMEYKYMLELLRNELYEEFFEDFKNVFVPFFDPAVYGRSILENSSFIVSSANPDPSLHGNGFVARLSGATAEFINIFLLMTVGREPFRLTPSNALELKFAPVLPEWLFTTEAKTERIYRNGSWEEITFPNNSFSFMFLGDILVTYHNKKRQCTFGPNAVSPIRWTLYNSAGECTIVPAAALLSDLAPKVRSKAFNHIEIELS